MRYPWQGRDAWIPWAFGAGFGVFLFGAVALAVIAALSDPGLVAGAHQRLAGSTIMPTGPAPVVDLRVVGRTAEGVVIEARILGQDGRPAQAETLSGTLQRATHARDDRPVSFVPAAGGAWRAVVAPAAGGVWEIAVRARSAGAIVSGSLRL